MSSVNIMIPAFEQVYAEFAECLVKCVQHNQARGIHTNVSFLETFPTSERSRIRAICHSNHNTYK